MATPNTPTQTARLVPEPEFCRRTGLDPRTVAEARKAHLQEPVHSFQKKGRRLLTAAGVARLIEVLDLPSAVVEELQKNEGPEPVCFWIVKRPHNIHLLRVRTEKNGGEERLVRCRDNRSYPVGGAVWAMRQGETWRAVAPPKKGGRSL